MDKLTKMQTLLPYLAELPTNDSTSAFWNAVQGGQTYAAACALLSLLTGEHRHTVYGIISALTGKRISDIIRQPFPIICKELLHALDEDMLLFCYMASAFGVRPVARVLYQYRPPCAMAIPELILVDRDNLKISMYACDMLRSIICMFSENGQDLPTIHEIIDPTSKASKPAMTAEKANAFVDEMIRRFGKKETSTNEQQA